MSLVISRALMTSFCVDLSSNLSTLTVSRVQCEVFIKRVYRSQHGARHFEYRRGKEWKDVST